MGDNSHADGPDYFLFRPPRCAAAGADESRMQGSFYAGAFLREAPMLEVLEWFKKDADDPAGPASKPAAAAGSLAGLRGADPAAALGELSGWLEPTSGADPDPKARSEKLAQIEETGAAHVSALLAQYLANAAGTQAARESAWKSLIQYQSRLTQALCASAEALMRAAREDAALLPAGTASSARALHACRTFAKTCLVHYSSVPPKLWRLAYTVHARAEKAGCASPRGGARADHEHRTVTTVEQELLRLLMLPVSAPDMMAPEQIEIADRVTEQLGGEFTLRPPGVADNPFCFEPAGDASPRRSSGPLAQPGPAAARYFGAGMGLDSLERIYKQLAAARVEDIKVFGMDIAPAAQLSAVQHLLTFWRADCPYTPPAHTRAAGSLEVTHRFAQVWQQLSQAHAGARELSLADAQDGVPQAPETWELRDAGGNELGAEFSPQRGGWAKCGEVVGVSVRERGEHWVGMIRRMHAGPGGSSHADIAVLSRDPKAVSLREVLQKGENSVFSEASSKQFAFSNVRAVILADGAEGSQPANLLLQPEHWREGRVYETQGEGPTRFLRGLQVVRRGGDYVRATFEWVTGPG
jgi:hypothetical protein